MPYWFDGNNLIGQSVAQARRNSATRQAFLLTLSAYAASRGGRFTVFFDGDDPDGRRAPKGVQVRYSAPMSTDDAILLRLREARTPAEIIVVTNDHSLRLRCREVGAKDIDWGEFVSRVNIGRKPRRRTDEKEDRPIDIGDWAEYFGLERESLK